jgi:hypothetical protein
LRGGARVMHRESVTCPERPLNTGTMPIDFFNRGSRETPYSPGEDPEFEVEYIDADRSAQYDSFSGSKVRATLKENGIYSCQGCDEECKPAALVVHPGWGEDKEPDEPFCVECVIQKWDQLWRGRFLNGVSAAEKCAIVWAPKALPILVALELAARKERDEGTEIHRSLPQRVEAPCTDCGTVASPAVSHFEEPFCADCAVLVGENWFDVYQDGIADELVWNDLAVLERVMAKLPVYEAELKQRKGRVR